MMEFRKRFAGAAVVTALVATVGVAVVKPLPTCASVRGDRTGQQDMTVSLNKQIAAVPEGGCLQFPKLAANGKPAKFRVSNRIVVDRKTNFSIFGQSATIFINNHTHLPLFEIRESRNILVRGLRLRGAEKDCIDTVEESPAEEFEAGMQVMWSENVVVERLQIRRMSGDGVFVGWGTQPNGGWAHGQIPPGTITPENPNGVPVVVPKSKHIRIRDNNIFCVARQGMAIAWTDDVIVERNKLHQVALTGIDLEHFGVEDLVIRRNYFNHVRQWMLIGQVPGDNWYFGYNTSEEPIYILVRHSAPQNMTIEYNTGGGVGGNPYEVWGPGSPLLVVRSAGKFRIIGNVQKFAPWVPALEFTQPYKYNIPGTSLNAVGGTCTAYAQGNTFAGAEKLWNPPAVFPSGCAWIDGGGNNIG